MDYKVDFKIGNLLVKVIEKEEFKGIRGGIWFKFVMGREGENRSYIFVLGEGEKKGSFPFKINPGKCIYVSPYGTTDYEFAHETRSGWKSLKKVVYVGEENKEIKEYKETHLTNKEIIIFTRLFNENKVSIMKTLLDENIIWITDYWSIWSDLKPLFYTYLKSDTIKLENNIYIVKEGGSWNSYFKWGKLSIKIPKVSKNKMTIIENPYDCCKQYNFKILKIGRKELFFKNLFDRKIVYYPIGIDRMIGLEEYQGHVHPEAIIIYFNSDNRFKYLDYLFNKRLGDLLFIDANEKDEMETGYYLRKANENQFKKVKILQGNLNKENMTIEYDDKIVIYHPEHGLLELSKGKYYIYSVPYIRKGHD